MTQFWPMGCKEKSVKELLGLPSNREVWERIVPFCSLSSSLKPGPGRTGRLPHSPPHWECWSKTIQPPHGMCAHVTWCSRVLPVRLLEGSQLTWSFSPPIHEFQQQFVPALTSPACRVHLLWASITPDSLTTYHPCCKVPTLLSPASFPSLVPGLIPHLWLFQVFFSRNLDFKVGKVTPTPRGGSRVDNTAGAINAPE